MGQEVVLAQYGSTGYSTGFRNRLINGDFRIWQRGTSLTYTGGAYTADMWIIEPRSSQSCTISQSTDVPTGEGHGFSGRFTATGGSLQGFHIRTAVENPGAGNYGEFQPGTVWTLSLWAKSVYTGVSINPYLFLTSNAISNPNSAVGVSGGSQTIAQSWTKYTWTVTMPTWVVDGGSLSAVNNLTVRLLVGAGSQDLYITGAQLEPGTQATTFDRRHISQETALAQRYYWQDITSNNGTWHSAFMDGNGSYPGVFLTFPVPMRTVPSGTFLYFSSYYYNNGNVASFTPAGGSTNFSSPTNTAGLLQYQGISNGVGAAQDQKAGQWYCKVACSADL
jgi:hypothetical protein